MKIVVIGAASQTGREVLNLMQEQDFPKEDVVALDRKEFLGKDLAYGEDHTIKVQYVDDYDFADTFLAIFTAKEDVVKKYAKKLALNGTYVIDSSAFFALFPDVPLVISGVNDDVITKYAKKKIIASPCACVTMLVSVLKPLIDSFGVERADVTFMHSVASLDKEGMDELFHQTKGIYMNQSTQDNQVVFPKQIAFNILPFLTEIEKDGFLSEERLTNAEVQKILGQNVKVNTNMVVAPVFFGLSAYINVQFQKKCDMAEVLDCLENADNVTVFNSCNQEGYATPAEIAGEDNIYLSRFKKDESLESGFNLFAVMETTRAGNALNLVRLAESLVSKHS